MAAGSVSPETDFSWLGDDFFEDDVSSLLSVGRGVMESVDRSAENFDLANVPKELYLFDDGGMAEWVADEVPAAKKRKAMSDVSSRFGNKLTSDFELKTMSKGFVPKSTEKSTIWAVRNFQSWCDWREKQGHPVPKNLLECNDGEMLNRWLSLFVRETRRVDGNLFPSRTIDMLLSGLKRYRLEKNPASVDILSEKDPVFAGLRGTRDTVARQLREAGVGASVKHTEGFTKEEESMLWCKGILGITSPKALLRAVFFANGKYLCLRGGREHKELKLSQFKFGCDEGGEFVEYVENGSKNRSGSYKDRAPNKVVKHYAQPELGDRDYLVLLNLYFSKLPTEVLSDETHLFYLSPKYRIPYKSELPWFKKMPAGRNYLGSLVKEVCKEAGIEGERSNHSLRVTGATRMWEANVPEKLIQQRTGHRSLEALRTYERTSITQQRAVSAVLASSEDADYQSEVSNKGQILPVSRPSSLIQPPISDTSAETRGVELFGKAFQSCHNCTISVNVNYNK